MLTINTLNINLTPSPFVTALVRAAMESTTSAGETAPEKTTPPKIGEVWPGANMTMTSPSCGCSVYSIFGITTASRLLGVCVSVNWPSFSATTTSRPSRR